MIKKLLDVNIKQFNDDEEDFSKYITEDGGLDVDSLVSDYEGSDEIETDDSEEGEGGPISHEENLDEEETHVNQDAPDEEPEQQQEKRTPDAAFAELRRRAEQNEKYAEWVASLATKQGFQEPEQLIEAFEKQQLIKEAQEKGVPVDVYERLQQLEKDNQTKEQEMFVSKFNNEVEQTKEKYKLDDENLDAVFKYMAQNGYVDENGKTSIPFEDAYVLANKDNLIKTAEERGRQSYLEEKQKLQKQATPNAGTSSEDKLGDTELDYSKDGIFSTLASMGIEVD